MAVFQSCAAAAAVFPALHAQLSFASFVFSLVWYFFLCRILFNIIGSYREVTRRGSVNAQKIHLGLRKGPGALMCGFIGFYNKNGVGETEQNDAAAMSHAIRQPRPRP